MDRLWVALPVFLICFAMFALNLVGGGDAKFFPVLVLFVPPSQFALFLMCFSAVLALALLLLWAARLHPASATSRWQGLRERKRFPMAVAFLIAAGLFAAVTL